MLRFTDNHNNTIYAWRHPNELNIQINFLHFCDCTIYLAKGAFSSGHTCITFHGNNATVFIGDSELGNSFITIDESACLYIGNRSHLNPYARTQYLRAIGNQILLIGNQNLFSEDLEISTVDQHLLYDINSLKRTNENKSIFIGDHVWLGRSSTILKGSRLASGCMLGIKALVSGKFIPHNTCNAGIPAKTLAHQQLWCGTNNFFRTPAEIAAQAAIDAYSQDAKDAIFAHDAAVVIRPCDIEYTLKTLKTSEERIAFLYERLYINEEHNRFAWNEDDASAENGQLLPYSPNTFSLHLENETPQQQPWIDLHHFTQEEVKAIKLIALWNRRFYIRWQYLRCSLMKHLSWGKRKTKYRAKKTHYKQLIKLIHSFKKLTTQV